jgi:hypothetical protein
MPRFVIFAGRLPGISTNANGILVSGPGKPVFAQLISQPLQNLVSIRLDVLAPRLRPLAEWLSTNRHHDDVNDILAPIRTLESLKPLLVGAWNFPVETPNALGPTMCFAILLGFLDEIFAAQKKGIVEAVATLPQWNAAFDRLTGAIFPSQSGPRQDLSDITNTILAFEGALQAAQGRIV